MPAYILTGAPGSGKTALLRMLETRGFAVVEEAATAVIALQQALGHAEPWTGRGFIEAIVSLQRRRSETIPVGRTVICDRSPVCTLALARFLDVAVPSALEREIARILAGGVYEKTAFLVRSQGFVEPTAARRISYEDSLEFEKLHQRVYRDFGFDLVEVPAGPLAERTEVIQRYVPDEHDVSRASNIHEHRDIR